MHCTPCFFKGINTNFACGLEDCFQDSNMGIKQKTISHCELKQAHEKNVHLWLRSLLPLKKVFLFYRFRGRKNTSWLD